MIQDYSLLGPECTGFADEQPAPGLVRMRVVENPRLFWEPWMAVGDRKYEHKRAADGSIVVDVPHAGVPGALKGGYVVVNK